MTLQISDFAVLSIYTRGLLYSIPDAWAESDGVSEMVAAASITTVRRDSLLYSAAMLVARTMHREEFASSKLYPSGGEE